MPIDVYGIAGAPASRVVLLTAAALNLEVNLKNTDLRKEEHLTPEFLKLNPQHTIPTIVDLGFSLWESRAIIRYFVNKYGKNTSLYPEDPKTRAIVDQRLDFDLGTLTARYANYFYPQFLEGSPPNEALLKKLEEALGFLDTFLEGQKYAAGSELTLADLALVGTVSTLDVVVGINIKAFPNVTRWYDLVKSTAPKYSELSDAPLEEMKAYIQTLKK